MPSRCGTSKYDLNHAYRGFSGQTEIEKSRQGDRGSRDPRPFFGRPVNLGRPLHFMYLIPLTSRKARH